MANKKRRLQADVKNEETVVGAFLRGFFWPFRMLLRIVVWVSHKPPLKQTGHFLRWVSHLKVAKFLAKALGIRYVIHSSKELRQVTWPSFRESLRLTSAVILFSVIFGILIAITDFGLDKLFKQVILK